MDQVDLLGQVFFPYRFVRNYKLICLQLREDLSELGQDF